MKPVPVVWQYALFFFAVIYAALGLGFIKDIKKIMIVFYIVVFLYALIYRRNLFKSTLCFFMLSAAVITVVSWYFMTLHHPQIANSSPNTEPMLDKFIFVPLAVALAGDRKKILVFLVVAAISALLLPWVKGDGLAEFEALLEGRRTGFGGNIITMGINYALILVAALVCMGAIASNVLREPNLKRITAVFFLMLLAIGGAIGVLGSQTRAVYVGLLVLFLLLLIKVFWQGVEKKKYGGLVVFALLLLAAGSTLQIASDRPPLSYLVDKVEREMVVVDEVITGNLECVTRNSAGLRIHFWADAAKWIAQRPITGWDDDANRLLHKEAGNFYKEDQYFHTIHNDYIELLLAYGILGLFLFVALVYWMLRRARLLVVSGVMPAILYSYFKLFIVFFMVNGLFMSILFFPDTRFSWNIVFAAIASFILSEAPREKIR